MEHFQFDASSSNRRGSMDKRKLAERNRDFDRIIRNRDIEEDPVVTTVSVDCIYTLNNYLKNLKIVFNNHYAKIELYKQNLVNKGIVKHVDNVIVCFFIVDTILWSRIRRFVLVFLKHNPYRWYFLPFK